MNLATKQVFLATKRLWKDDLRSSWIYALQVSLSIPDMNRGGFEMTIELKYQCVAGFPLYASHNARNDNAVVSTPGIKKKGNRNCPLVIYYDIKTKKKLKQFLESTLTNGD
ncbi:MAG: hypothetical protein C5B52_08855 [Bacteroidetes bacterium]|nr:MAG: hypothetical protein C5B52_08855 [Bacteroidota bacterium]